MDKNLIDIKENYIHHLDNELLAILLQDHSSKQNIIWAKLVQIYQNEICSVLD